MSKIPVSLIIDDGGPVNLFHFHDLKCPHELLVEPAFFKEFAKICSRNNIMGKYSFVPVPAGLGRIDKKLSQVPAKYIKDYIKITKEEIEPVFSITSEILTHYLAYNLQTGGNKHICEDVFVSTATDEEIAEYVGLSLEILSNVGLNPTGVTSPWATGIDNEENYAKGIGKAFCRVMKKKECFYFLHSRDTLKKPVVMFDTPETGRVVSVPNNTVDAFWFTQNPLTKKQAVQNAKKAIDSLLSADGRTGVMRELFDAGDPIIFISHWQSLYSDGRKIGLEGLDALTQRMNKIFGKEIEWMPMAELAKRTVK